MNDINNNSSRSSSSSNNSQEEEDDQLEFQIGSSSTYEEMNECTYIFSQGKRNGQKCKNQLTNTKERFGADEYCHKCLGKDRIQELLQKRALRSCSYPKCLQFVLKKTDKDFRQDGDEEYCSYCLDDPQVQANLNLAKHEEKPNSEGYNEEEEQEDGSEKEIPAIHSDGSSIRIQSARIPKPAKNSPMYYVRGKYKFDHSDVASLAAGSFCSSSKEKNLKTHTIRNNLTEHAQYLINSVLFNNLFHLSRILLRMGNLKHGGGLRKLWTNSTIQFEGELVVLKAIASLI
jgi:hypothetical protein